MNLHKSRVFYKKFLNRNLLNIPVRFRHNTEFMKLKYEKPEPTTACDIALKHFDDFYKAFFSKKWPSVRLGLLSPQKKIAIINNLGDIEETVEFLENKGAIDLKNFFEVQKSFLSKQQNEIKNASSKNLNLIDDVIKSQYEAKKTEFQNIYHADKDIEITAKFYNENQTDDMQKLTVKKKEDYDIEESMTSMDSDKALSKINYNRLILPNSNSNDANLHEFVPVTKLRGLDEYISESEYYKYYQPKPDFFFHIEKEYNLNFPKDLKAYAFDRGDMREIPEPARDENYIYKYLLMDGADLLTVLALDLQFGDAVFDMIPNSGNKAFSILQTNLVKILVCNTCNEMEEFFKNHLFDYSPAWKDTLLLTSVDFDDPYYHNLFDKILLDIFCTDDRECLTNPDENYYSVNKLKDRLKLPQNQTVTLANALKMVKPGGTVVYTTGTMSPIQNDGIVDAAIRMVMENTDMRFCVRDLSPALSHTNLIFNYGTKLNMKYGTLVVPFLPSNFGPRYFSKIIKLN